MKYKTGAAFRQALDAHIQSTNKNTGLPLARLRKLVAFDRFLVRLFHDQPDGWVLKGGFALQLRLGERARTTKDIDLLAREQGIDIGTALRAVGLLDMGDHFLFEVEQITETVVEALGVIRFNIRSRLDNRMFETFHIDVGVGDPVIGAIEYLETTDLLAFAEIEPTCVPCYPITQQIAEKLHAYSQTYRSGSSSRVKDFVDLLLLAELGDFNNSELEKAIAATFKNVGKHEIPKSIAAPPRNWLQTYRRMSGEVGLEASFDEAVALLQQFLDPVLASRLGEAKWNSSKWVWG